MSLKPDALHNGHKQCSFLDLILNFVLKLFISFTQILCAVTVYLFTHSISKVTS